MATVYRGFDTLLARDVAIKVLHAERASEAYRQRMLQEGRAAVRTSHPHLLQIFDVGRVGDTTYLVMELLTGNSLTRHLRDRPPARWSDVLTLLLPAIDAFAALHAAGLVHRDIKPANLFVRERGEALAIVVIDFGITKLSPEMSARIGLVDTQAGTLLGTPAYMAPEQGNGDTADARSDVYSFGVTLYEALAGRLPFPPEPGDTWVSLLTKHMYAAVPPLPRDIPSSVASIVERTLAKLPEDRFQSMQDLAAALRSCLDAPRSAAPPRRATWPLAAAGLGVIATLAVTTARAPAQPLDTPCDEPDAADPRFLWPPAPTILLAHTEPPATPLPTPPARRRWLSRLAPVVADCTHTFGDPDAHTASISLTFDRRGLLLAADLPGAPRVGACVVSRLDARRFPASGRVLHTFRWAPNK